MKRITFIFVLLSAFVFILVSQVSAIEVPSEKIERVEIGENMKTTLYADGRMNVEVLFFETFSIQSNLQVEAVTSIHSPPQLPDSVEIWEMIRGIIGTLGKIGPSGMLLGFGIWRIVIGLRRGRPRDYSGVGLDFIIEPPTQSL